MTPTSWIILITASFTMMLINFNFTALNLALVDIAKDMPATLYVEQWLLSLYVLIIAILLFPSSRLSNLYSRRNIFIWSAAIFSAASLIIANTDSMMLFLMGRILQGISAALFIPNLYFLALTHFPQEKKTTVIAFITAGLSIGLSMGPTIGPFIQKASSWRWIFLMNIPLCAIIAGIIAVTVKNESSTPGYKKNYLYLFSLLCSALLLTPIIIKYFFSSFSLGSWFLLLGICFIYSLLPKYDKDTKPLIPFSVFKNTNFTICAAIIFCSQYAFAAILFVSCIYMQEMLGYKILFISMILAALTVPMGVFSAISSYLSSKISPRALIITGLFFLALGNYLFSKLTNDSTTGQIVIALLPAGTGIGLLISLANTIIAQSIESTKIRSTSGIVYVLSTIANVLGIFFSAVLLTSLGRDALSFFIKNSNIQITASELLSLQEVVKGLRYDLSSIKTLHPSIVSDATSAIQDAFTDAMYITFLIPSFLSLLAAIYVFFRLKEN